eukprot:scaffold62290_cov57-Phaeocystis_antarctica.AAC.2
MHGRASRVVCGTASSCAFLSKQQTFPLNTAPNLSRVWVRGGGVLSHGVCVGPARWATSHGRRPPGGRPRT